MRILLVEDEERLAQALEYILKRENYKVDVTGDGEVGQDMAETKIYDVIILDRMLPNRDGIEILKYIRGKGIKSAVIFLTAKDTVSNRIEGLDAGADDYLIKPFAKDELLARVRALGRRKENIVDEGNLSVGKLTLNTKECMINDGEKEIKLSLQESQLLEYFMENKEQTLSKGQIFDKIWGFDTDVEISNVEVYVFYLRKKIDFEKNGLSLKTIRGIGYVLKEKK